jgi:hypothetical protein
MEQQEAAAGRTHWSAGAVCGDQARADRASQGLPSLVPAQFWLLCNAMELVCNAMELAFLCDFYHRGRNNRRVGAWCIRWADMGSIAVIDRAYFLRQIRTLLTFARSTSDPAFAAFLLDKADDLRSQAEQSPPARDLSPRPPDVELER